MKATPPCPLCDGVTVALEPPHASRAMLSDGRILPKPLRKVSCLACGATSHRERLSESEVQAIYGKEYALAATAPAADAVRAAHYAAWIGDGLPMPRSVLEVGCGSGALLRRLASEWHGTTFLGFDPAAPHSSDPRVVLKRGFLEILESETRTFDLIVAVNVIEHSHDPAHFLATLAPRLADGGTLVIVCPAATPPNVELLFYDHLWTLTPAALAAAAKPAGLTLSRHQLAPAAIGDFQMVWFQKGRIAEVDADRDQLKARQDYLRAWHDLDQRLAKRVPHGLPLWIFGAGQAAALVRAYAPETWQRAGCLMLDDVSEAWTLDKPVKPYDNRGASRHAVLIATAARAQGAVAKRLADDGFMPIRWDDLISH